MRPDVRKINGFVNRRLGDALLTDLFHFNVFNEGDMQAATYHHLRRYFEKYRHGNWIVRCQPSLKRGKATIRDIAPSAYKPDLCLFNRYKPIHMIELKFFSDNFHEELVLQDIDKLKQLKKHYPSVRVCFLVFVYDSDTMAPELTSYYRTKYGLKGFCVVPINARRQRHSKRLRTHYRAWKKKWLKLSKWQHRKLLRAA